MLNEQYNPDQITCWINFIQPFYQTVALLPLKLIFVVYYFINGNSYECILKVYYLCLLKKKKKKDIAQE